MSYWDINQFLAEQETIQFCFKTDAHFMDFLDPTKQGVIKQGQTINTSIWLVNTIYDYLQMGDSDAQQLKVTVPADFHVSSLDRINSFRSRHRSTIEKVRIKSQMPYFYEIYEAIKKITDNHEGVKFQGQKIAEFLQERGKLIISRANTIFEQSRADPITNNYTKFQMDLYRLTRQKSLQYQKWKTS